MKDLIELRLYSFKSEEKRNAFEEFLGKAMVPALNRAGVKPVGAFRLLKEDNPDVKRDWDTPVLYVLLPHKTPQSLATLEAKLAADAAYQDAGKAVLAAPKEDPAYLRYETSLLVAFDQAPTVQVPARSETRLMQLRIYESHSDERAAKKIEMFNQGGELATFKKCGMNWVFFGKAIAGAKMPNLTYMLAFESKDAQTKAWGEFGKHPDWIKLRDDPAYKDTVSTITNLILKPSAASQV